MHNTCLVISAFLFTIFLIKYIGTYFQYKYAIQLAILKYLYLNQFLSFQLFYVD